MKKHKNSRISLVNKTIKLWRIFFRRYLYASLTVGTFDDIFYINKMSIQSVSGTLSKTSHYSVQGNPNCAQLHTFKYIFFSICFYFIALHETDTLCCVI